MKRAYKYRHYSKLTEISYEAKLISIPKTKQKLGVPWLLKYKASNLKTIKLEANSN